MSDDARFLGVACTHWRSGIAARGGTGLAAISPQSEPGGGISPRWISDRRAGARRPSGGVAVRGAGGVDGAVASLARAVPRVSLERVQQPGYDSVSRIGRVADRACVSRRAVVSGIFGGGGATAGRGGPVLARPTLLQASASRRRGGMAPGLFLLDADAAHGAPDVLDGAGRQHARQWLLVLRPRKPQVEPTSDYRACGRHERDHDGAG